MIPEPNTLAWHDLQWCLRRTPAPLLQAMKNLGARVIVAGGFIRACVAGDDLNDIDVFVPSREFGETLALLLAENDKKKIHETDNAFTIRGFRPPVQIIHRWVFTDPVKAIESFDFTIARAAFWWDATVTSKAGVVTGAWRSVVDPRFYQDLAGHRLIYMEPVRIEEAGGSMLRVLKFYQRGYRIPLDSMGAVIARLVSGVEGLNKWRLVDGKIDEIQLAKVLTGLLREVDPNVDPHHLSHLPSETQEEEAKPDAPQP